MMDMMGGMNGLAGSSGSMNMGGNMNAGMSTNGMGNVDAYAQAGNMANHGATAAGSLNGGWDFNSLITGILNFSIQLMFLLLVVGLVVGIFIYIKNYLNLNRDSLRNLAVSLQGPVCSGCGRSQKNEWKCCPHCGREKETAVAVAPVTQTV